MLEKPILPHDIMSVSVIEEIIYWLQSRGNKDIDKYKVVSFNEDGYRDEPENSWSFKLVYKEPYEEFVVLSINLRQGIKQDGFKKEEANNAMKALKSTYKLEHGEITSINVIQGYFE